MKNPIEESKRWAKQANYDLGEAKASLERGSFAYACFFAEQAAQKFLKGYLILQGERFIPLHSVGDLLTKAAGYTKEFRELLEEGRKLDRYYILTRYPDALPAPNVPFESYSKDEAEEAIKTAQKIARLAAGT